MRLLAGCLAAGVICGAGTAQDLPQADRAQAREIFRQLVETNTTDSVGSVTKAAEAMRQRLLAGGFAAENLRLLGPNARKMNLVATYRGRAGSAMKPGGRLPILIICHLDVVEARREDWTTDPFVFTEKDGFFYGRGTQDVKDGDAALVESFLRMKREGYVPDRDLTLALTADEETGDANGVEWLEKHHPELMQAAFVINPDAGGVFGEHGVATVLDLEATEKTYADFHVTATNKGGHSSLPVPDNALYQVANGLVRLEHAPMPFELNAVTRGYFAAMAKIEKGQTAEDMRAILRTPMDAAAAERLAKNPEYNSVLRTTCVATMMSAGHSPNALPARAQANVNCRILPGHSIEETRQELVRVFNNPVLKVEYVTDGGVVMEKGSDRVSAPPPPVNATVEAALKQVAGQLWPGLPIVPVMEAGATDSVYTTEAGVASYAVNGFEIDAGDVRMHGRDERLGVESFYKGVEFMYLFLKALTAG